MLRLWLSACLLLLLTVPVGAAPPAVTHFFPPGAPRGGTVEVRAYGTFEKWPVRAWVDGSGVEVKAGRAKGRLTVTVAADAEPGVRWLRLFDEQGASALRPFVIGVLPEVLEKEPNDDSRKPQILTGRGATVNGRLDKSGDADCFALKLTKGQTLVASVEANRTLGSPMDGIVQVLSEDGFVLEENNDFYGLDPQVTFSVPKDGTYVVRLVALPATPDATVRFAGGDRFIYRLTLTAGGWADHPYPLAVSRTNPASVDVVGWNVPEAARKRLVDVGPGPREPGTSVRLFHPEVANTVAVRVESHPTLVHVDPGDRKQPQAVTLPATVTGRIDRDGAAHVYQFPGRKGQRLTFQVESRVLNFPLEPALRLTDASGKVLGQAQSPSLATDPVLNYTVPADGAYRIEVRDLLGHSSPRHLYRLRATVAEPDFALTLPSESFTLTPGKPLDVAVAVDRRNGFTGPVDLRVEGVPKGVKAEVLPAAANAASRTVRLTAEKGAESTSGPIHILGQGKDLKEGVRWARVKGAEAPTATPHAWLVVKRGESR